MSIPEVLGAVVFAVGGLMLLAAYVWLGLALIGWALEVEERNPLVFLALMVVTFPWGLIVWLIASRSRAIDSTPEEPSFPI